MAYNNGGARNQGGQRDNYGYNHYQNSAPRVIEPKSLPDDFVDVAEKHMNQCYRSITTSKIRNLLSLVIDCYQAESRRTDENITPESADALTNMRIRVVYEMGRDDRNVGQFVRETELLQYLAGIRGNRKALIRFYHYMEALVAYHKYMGGKEG
ncbi:MAG: type III-A CRISPR-associated protein Csm2 [Oscillibacter sp.]|nr:type III-A CRISPR-associated protein Csm2 [Oscillibacter sp.]